MNTKLNKLVLFSVGVTGLGLIACGPSEKDGQPVDPVTTRQALVGNTKALAADISRTAKFLERSELLHDVFRSTSPSEPTVCTPAPEGGTVDCGTEAPVEEEVEIDVDITDETDQAMAEFETRVLADAAIESQEEFAITYLVRGDLVCEQEGEPLDQDCVDDVNAAEIRLVVTSPADGDVDVDVLVGPNRVNPLSFQVHQDLLAMEADLGGIKDAATHINGIVGGDLEMPATMKGRVRLELSAPSDQQLAAAVSVLQAVTVADGDFAFSVGQSLPLLSLTVDASAETLTSVANAGPIDGLFPATTYSYDSETDVETESSYQLGFHIAGSTGTTVLDVANEVLSLTGIGLGSDTSTVSIDGEEVVAIDLNADNGRTFDATVTADGDDAVKIEVSPEFDLRVALQLIRAAAVLDDVDDWMLDDVLNIALDGAAKPAVRIAGEQVEVLEGTLTMSLANAGITHTVASGQCLLSDNDAPVAGSGTTEDPDTAPQPQPIEEDTSYNPLDDLLVGACQ